VATVGEKTYAAFAAPFQLGSNMPSTGLAWYELSSTTPQTALGFSFNTPFFAQDRAMYVNAAVLADAAGDARILGVRAIVETSTDGVNDWIPSFMPWVRNEYAIYAPDATAESDALATLALDGMYVLSLAAWRNPDGVQNVWWAIENTIGGSDYTLKRYTFANGTITEEQSIDLTGPGRISFSSDGTIGYIETASGRLRYAVAADGAIGDWLGIDALQGATLSPAATSIPRR
jgi:hypothetical protein